MKLATSISNGTIFKIKLYVKSHTHQALARAGAGAGLAEVTNPSDTIIHTER